MDINDEDLKDLIIEIEELIEKAFDNSIEYYRKLRRQVKSEKELQRSISAVDIISILDDGIILSSEMLIKKRTGAVYNYWKSSPASLAWLYFHIITYSSGFIGQAISFENYFEPVIGWTND